MTEKTVAQKMHIKPGASIAFVHAPDGLAHLLDLPADVTQVTDVAAAGLDVSRDTIWPVAEALGMRPVAMVSIDERWSGFRVKLAQ